MKLTKINLSGFCNVKDFHMDLMDLNALVAPNNYGKSNVLAGIEFAMLFISSSEAKRIEMMSDIAYIPINNSTSSLPFRFSIEGVMNADEANETVISYSFEFCWKKSNGEGLAITSEFLSIISPDNKRPRTIIKRDSSEEGMYVPSAAGRCNKVCKTNERQLVVNLLGNNEGLFYQAVLSEINNIHLNIVKPSGFDKEALCRFIYHLKEDAPDKYSLLEDFALQIVDNMTSIRPVRTVIGEENPNVPFRVEDAIYDIRIKEKCNNQDISVSRLSSGSRRIIMIISEIIKAEMSGSSLICIEELENSVHPKLLENIVLLVQSFAEGVRIITTSHSPYLVRYLHSKQLSFGLPSKEGVTSFHKVRSTMVKRIMRSASSMDMTLGEYMFELMLNMDEESLSDFELFED